MKSRVKPLQAACISTLLDSQLLRYWIAMLCVHFVVAVAKSCLHSRRVWTLHSFFGWTTFKKNLNHLIPGRHRVTFHFLRYDPHLSSIIHLDHLEWWEYYGNNRVIFHFLGMIRLLPFSSFFHLFQGTLDFQGPLPVSLRSNRFRSSLLCRSSWRSCCCSWRESTLVATWKPVSLHDSQKN